MLLIHPSLCSYTLLVASLDVAQIDVRSKRTCGYTASTTSEMRCFSSDERYFEIIVSGIVVLTLIHRMGSVWTPDTFIFYACQTLIGHAIKLKSFEFDYVTLLYNLKKS